MSTSPTGIRSPGASQPSPFLSKERIIARPGFNRWLVPPAALAIHLCIGMAYGFSVFWLPLSRAVGITQPLACPSDMGFFAEIVATSCDWKISMLGWMYTLFFVLLGSSAALWGGLAGAGGPAQGRCGFCVLLVRGAGHFGPGGALAPNMDALAGVGCHRRYRSWAGLHLAGLDADQVVS